MENRYDKYKDSGIAWIGEIPEHWSLVSIGKLFNIYAGGDAKPDYYSDTKDLEHPFPVYTNTKSEHEIYAYTSKAIFPANTITVTGRGDVGHAIYRRTPYDAIIRLLSLIPKNNYDCRFYTYFIDIVIPFMDGKSAVAQLSALQLKPQFVCFPSNEEQQSIATYLDQKCGEIDELITMQEEMITKLQSYKQSVITEAVTKGLDKNVPLKDSGIEWIGNTPEHWNKNKIIRLFGIIGSGTTPKSSKEDNYIGSVNWIQSGDINGGYIESCKNTISDTALKEYTTLKIYKAPFIIVAMYGASVGNISISNIDGCVNQACCVMNETKQNFKYLFYAMNSVKKYLIYKAEGGGQPNISQDKIKNTWLPIPPLSEQQSIANYLDQKCSEIDELISIKQQKIEKLKDYKKSLIFEYVTGKRKV